MKNSLFKYSWLLQQLVQRDIKAKYKRSYLGYVWTLLQPLMMMIVLTIVFSNIFRFQIDNFPAYLICGQVMFTFFAESTSASMSSIISSAGLLKQVYIPKYIIPLAKVTSSLFNLCFSVISVFIVLIATNTTLHWTVLLLPIPVFNLFFISLGMSLLVSSLAVYFRDLMYLYGIFLQILSYLTPLFYPVEMLPDSFQKALMLNPLFHIVSYFRKIMLYGEIPTLLENMYCVFFSIFFMIIGCCVFKRSQKTFLLYI